MDDIHLIDLDQELPGQRRFISCWVRLGPGPTFIVDPGPPATAARLMASLEEMGLVKLDYILLTHIHLDHGGATAAILERWPAAKVVCHPRGRSHLVRPHRLWESSQKVLREKAQVYGEPRPVPAVALAEYAEIAADGISVIETPGHAPHHICFRTREDLFLGEAAGTFSSLGRGPTNPKPYLRPATPSGFDLEIARRSLEKLLALQPGLPGNLRFAHHGVFRGEAASLLRTAQDQLELWVTICAEVAGTRGEMFDPTGKSANEALFRAIREKLLSRDAWFARGERLPADIRERERDFTRQSLTGMLGYLRDKS